jgi:hypothetical protein
MASSVLGKRTRSCSDSGTTERNFPSLQLSANPSSSASKVSLSRPKRQARADIPDGENNNPFYIKRSCYKIEDDEDDPEGVDPLSDFLSAKSTPVKHGLVDRRVASSPLKSSRNLSTIRNNGQYGILEYYGLS